MPLTIDISKDFGRYPGGRFIADGPYSGEEFRESKLLPALRSNETVTVVLDDVAGLPASFLEEAFGGLVRSGFSAHDLRTRLRVIAETPRLRRYPAMIWEYIETAESALPRAV